MRDSASAAIIVPARTTVGTFAARIGVDAEEVARIIRARDESSGQDDMLGPTLAVEIAGILGVSVMIEPRDLALEYLYEHENRGEIRHGLTGRVERLVQGVIQDLDGLDRQIESVAEHWSVARMPVVDRNILRLGLYELINEPQTSSGVIMAEAVRLAQTYSTERSASFVNGVLATLSVHVRDG